MDVVGMLSTLKFLLYVLITYWSDYKYWAFLKLLGEKIGKLGGRNQKERCGL